MLKKLLTWLIWKTLPSCKDVTALMSRSLEAELSWRERQTMRFHLWSCLACNRYLSQIKFMSEVFELQEETIQQTKTPVMSSEAAERLKKALKSSKPLMFLVLTTCV